MKRIIGIVLISVLAGFILHWLVSSRSDNQQSETIITHSEVLEKIEAIGKLELVRVSVRDIMEYEKVRQWLPNARSVLVIYGEAVGCIDLMKIKEENLYINKDTLKIILPAPELCYSKIDHSKSKVFDTQNHFFSGAKIIDEAYRDAEEHLQSSVLNAGILSETKNNASSFFYPFFKVLGFKEIYIRFEGDLNFDQR